MTSLCVHSNLGGNTINEVALDFWRAGRAREEIPLELLERRLRLELQEAAGKGWACLGAVGSCCKAAPLQCPMQCVLTGLCLGEQALTLGVVDNESPSLGPCEPRGPQAPSALKMAGPRGSSTSQGSAEASPGLQTSLGVTPRDALCSEC